MYIKIQCTQNMHEKIHHQISDPKAKYKGKSKVTLNIRSIGNNTARPPRNNPIGKLNFYTGMYSIQEKFIPDNNGSQFNGNYNE